MPNMTYTTQSKRRLLALADDAEYQTEDGSPNVALLAQELQMSHQLVRTLLGIQPKPKPKPRQREEALRE